MQAAVIPRHGSSEQVEVVDVPRPDLFPGGVRLRLHAAALNHLDLFVIGGIPGLNLSMPHVLGADGAGVVVEVGESVEVEEGAEAGAGVDRVAVGDEVVLDPGLGAPDEEGYALLGEMVPGTFAEEIVVPAANCFAKPERLSWTEAAAFPLVTLTAWRMLVSKARLRADEWVLIHGIGGGVSLAALQIAGYLGARAVVTSHSEAKRNRALELGAAHAIDYVTDDIVAATREVTGGRGVDVVVDNVGEATFAASIRACRKGGRIVTCGATTGPRVPVDVRRVFWNQLSIFGSTMGSSEEFRDMLAVVDAGKIVPVVDKVFPLTEARAALERLEKAEQFGKIVIDIAG